MKDNEKNIVKVFNNKEKHWVGDGFHVCNLLRPDQNHYALASPFLLLDFAPETYFPPTDKKRGVGAHPHKGFETVTFAYKGEVAHKDSSGGGGLIQEGDVQWMTAGKGIVHEEFHSESFCRTGGLFEMVQLWINLPKKHKNTKAKYQSLNKKNIPSVKITDYSFLKVVSGKYQKTKGLAKTFSPINIFQIESIENDNFQITLEEKSNTLLLTVAGELIINGQNFQKGDLIIFGNEGKALSLKTFKNFKGLLLNAEALNEPMYWHGPFVMNSKDEIIEAIKEYSS